MANDPVEPVEEKPAGEPERLSLAAYLGGATGLVVGVIVAIFLSATLFWWSGDSRTTEIFWGITSPLLGFLGVVVGSLIFQRLFRSQALLPAVIFLSVLAAGIGFAFVVVGFPWMEGA